MSGQPVAYWDVDGTTYFQQADWVGTQRLLTNYAGSNVSAYRSNPFGDEYSASGKDDNTQHYAGLEHDAESATDHAQFRQYNTNLGQWMSLDPCRGSYDFSNPQSYNRYTYAMNNPLSLIDPAGLRCVTLDNGVVGDDGTEPPCGSDMTPGTGPDATVFGGIVPWFIQEYGFTPGWLQSVAPIASDTSILPSLGPLHLAPNNGPKSQATCIADALKASIPGAANVDLDTSVSPRSKGGHENFVYDVSFSSPAYAQQFAQNTNRTHLLNGTVSEYGYGPGQRLDGGVHAEFYGYSAGLLQISGHLDAFNPNNGVAPLLGHFFYDVLWGTLRGSNHLDKGC